MERRSFLAASGTALTVFSVGCIGAITDRDQRSYEFSLYNGSRESHSISVRIGNSLQGHFQEDTFEMDGETANESVPVEKIPSRIYLEIDSADERTYPWPASTSELGNIASKVDIWYEPTLEQEILIQEG